MDVPLATSAASPAPVVVLRPAPQTMPVIFVSPHSGRSYPEALLAAAEKLLEDGGVPAVTLRAIAREAGVSHGAPAHHFKDLSELLEDNK